jgi:hypothetical protein
MRRRVIVLLLTVISGLHVASATGFSTKTNGVYLAIESWGTQKAPLGQITNEPFAASNALTFSVFCETGKVELQYSPDPAYFVRIRMTDKNGREVPKTALGTRFGSKFDDKELRAWKNRSVGILLAWGSYEENHGQGMAKSLPSPEDLFEITEPGVFTMEIEMQMFRVITVPKWKREFFRFSPVMIKVEKEKVSIDK